MALRLKGFGDGLSELNPLITWPVGLVSPRVVIDFLMIKTATIICLVGLQLTSIATTSAQPSPHPYNPDSDGDGYVGVSDVLSVLSYFESYYPIYPPSSSSVLLVSQDGCGTELFGDYWSGVTWIEPGMDTLFVPYGYDEVLINSNYDCSGIENYSPLVVVLLNPPGSNEDDQSWVPLPPVFSVKQETRIHAPSSRQLGVISWHETSGWYAITDITDNWNYQNPWWSTGAPAYSKTYIRIGNEPWRRAD